jgi:hypothetical protein
MANEHEWGPWTLCALVRHEDPDGQGGFVLLDAQPVTDDEAREAIGAIEILLEDHEQAEFNLVAGNFRAFAGYLQSAPDRFEQAVAGAVNPVKRLQSDLAARLFNWLNSVRAYIEHTEVRISRRYGKDSDELAAFKEITSKEFDEAFAYRFFYKLRNYGHVAFPALELDHHETRPIGMPLQVSVSLAFKRDSLLRNYDEWGKVVRRDLEARPERFDALPLLVAMMESLERVKAAVGVIEFGTLAGAVDVLDRLKAKLGAVDGAPTLVRIDPGPDPSGPPRRMQMIDLPPFELPLPDD